MGRGRKSSVRVVRLWDGSVRRVVHRGYHMPVEVLVGGEVVSKTHDVYRTLKRLLSKGKVREGDVLLVTSYGSGWLVIKLEGGKWVGYVSPYHPREKGFRIGSGKVVEVSDIKELRKFLKELREKHPLRYDEKPVLAFVKVSSTTAVGDRKKRKSRKGKEVRVREGLVLTEEELEEARKVFEGRSERSKEMDLRRVAHLPSSFEAWLKHPNKYDLPGVDAPDGVEPPPKSVRGTPTVKKLVQEIVRKFGKPVAVVRGAVFSVDYLGGRRYRLVKLLGYVGASNSLLIDSKGVPHTLRVPEEVRRLVTHLRGKYVREKAVVTSMSKVVFR